MAGDGAEVVTVFVLGDLHYPDFIKETTNPDIHDPHPPGDIADILGLPLGTLLSTALVKQISASEEPIVLICGDVTTRGDRDGYNNGLQFLADILSAPTVAPKLAAERVHLVPGNHDIAFKSTEGRFSSFHDTSRFEQLADDVVESELDTVLTLESRRTDISYGAASIALLSLNTSLGSGAPRHIDLPTVMNGTSTTASTPSTTDEMLDVPIVVPAQLQHVNDLVGATTTALPVLLAHHGLLPQYIPRLNPYTEMVNAGQVRQALASGTLPVLYIHGHIHADVVEVVQAIQGSSSGVPGHPMVAISAPELKDGFQQLDLHFTSDGLPLGVEITRWRIQAGSVQVTADPNRRRVPLVQPSLADQAKRELLRHMADVVLARGEELIRFGQSMSPQLNAAEVEAHIQVLTWRGILTSTESIARPSFAQRGFRLL